MHCYQRQKPPSISFKITNTIACIPPWKCQNLMPCSMPTESLCHLGLGQLCSPKKYTYAKNMPRTSLWFSAYSQRDWLLVLSNCCRADCWWGFRSSCDGKWPRGKTGVKGACCRQIDFPAVWRRAYAATRLLLSAVVASLKTLGQSSSSSMMRPRPCSSTSSIHP